ncbi:MAG: YqeG family HAD IIIA-type phosphatase [Clostridia bacterium]|nr:YqeG family HAD IIIA-type phosphatase [Clostridia bacterium]
MLERFYPSFVYSSVIDIPYSLFEKNGIKAVIFDMDNTLVNSKYIYDEKVKIWLKDLKEKGIKVCILSNTPNYKKVEQIGKELSMPYLHRALKPWSFGFKKALKILNEPKESIAIIGDQVFTDVYGGNRFGIKTILVEPIDKNEFFITKMKRPVERLVIKKYKERVESKG